MADVKELNINNTNYDIKAKTIVDQNSGSLKLWTGTKAEYDAITTKDPATLYNITDDSDVTFQLLELIYPVGSIYIGTMSVCPLQTLGLGTWELVAEDRVLQGAGTRGSVGTTVNESLPIPSHTHDRGTMNITGSTSGWYLKSDSGSPTSSGAITISKSSMSYAGTSSQNGNYLHGFSINASRNWTGSTSQPNGLPNTYQDSAPVQQDAYLVNIWKRIS